MSITLVVTAGPHLGQTFSFDRHDTFLVGRGESANLSLPEDPYFSRMHFLVEVNPPLCRLTDLNSHNGTLVNGSKVQVVDLHNGDEIRGGQTALRVSVSTAKDAAATLDLPERPQEQLRSQPPHHIGATLDEKHLGLGLQQTDHRAPKGQTDGGTPSTGGTSLPQPPGLPSLRRYHLLREIDRGGMGVVYRGICEADRTEVAVKMIRPQANAGPTAVGRFLREAAILKELRHERIVGFRDSGLAGNLLYFVMDFVPGRDAARLVAADGPLDAKRAVGLGLQMLEALAYAHGKGYVHRDVKPANLLVSGTPPAETLRVADFGLARTYQESALSGLTLSGTTAGTPKFMPPEQVTDFRHVRPAGDQYSAAATLYFLLTGCCVYDSGPVNELFRKMLLEDPVPLGSRRPDLPPELTSAIHRALARRPQDRYPDTATFANALQPFA